MEVASSKCVNRPASYLDDAFLLSQKVLAHGAGPLTTKVQSHAKLIKERLIVRTVLLLCLGGSVEPSEVDRL